MPGDEQLRTLRRAVRAVLEPLAGQGLVAERLALALPSGYDEFQRRHLLAGLVAELPPLRLIDTTTAAFHAFQGHGDDIADTVAILVAEDFALEVALADVRDGRCDIFAHNSLEALAGRALNHHLFQLLLERLPDDAAPGSARAPRRNCNACCGGSPRAVVCSAATRNWQCRCGCPTSKSVW